ncbi:TPA: hypothetical protein ACH3X2_003857 [Trebouxia sp. C0005]
MPPRRQIADKPDRKQDLKSFLKSEYYDQRKYAANLSLLKAVALFAGSVVVMRNFGDVFAI